MCALLQEYPCCDRASAFPQIDSAQQHPNSQRDRETERPATMESYSYCMMRHLNPALPLPFPYRGCTRYPQGHCTVRSSMDLTIDFQSSAYARWSVSERQQQKQTTLASSWQLLCRLSLRWQAHNPPTVRSYGVWCISHTKKWTCFSRSKGDITVFMKQLFSIQWQFIVTTSVKLQNR